MSGATHADGGAGGGWRPHVPNILTGVRIVLACVFFAVLSVWRYVDSPAAKGEGVDGLLLGATALFVLAAVTDALDGHLARRWKAVSVFGRIMDPFADKLLIIGAFAFLASPAFCAVGPDGRLVQVSAVEAWMVAVILGRELLVTSIRGAMEGSGVSFAASWSGKLKMILQCIVVPAILLVLALRPMLLEVADAPVWYTLMRWLVGVTVLVTAWSGVPYVIRAARDAGARGGCAGSRRVIASHVSTTGQRLVTTFGLGLLRPAPGTWGSLPPVLLAVMLLILGARPTGAGAEAAWEWPQWLVFHVILLGVLDVFSYACLRWGDEAEAVFGKKDPGSVCADETAGMCIPLLFLPGHAMSGEHAHWTLLLAFLLFRFFDIVKLPPARGLQRHPGGAGILLDDLAAGVQAMLALQIVARLAL